MSAIFGVQRGDCERYTPRPLRELAREVLGSIDLDPCTHPRNPLGAKVFYTKRENGLRQQWPSSTRALWMNPVFGEEIVEWLFKVKQLADAQPLMRALVLVPTKSGARWYRECCEHAQVRCELDGRVVFETYDRTGQLVPARHAPTARAPKGKLDQAPWGCTLFYWGPERHRAARLLRDHGFVSLLVPSRVARAPRIDRRQMRLV
jgi:hypothetical protein